MRGAPPVQMACGRDARWAAAVALLLATSSATLVGWLAWHAAPADRLLPLLAAAATFGVAALTAWGRVARQALRPLAWDGRTWMLSGAPCGVEVMIDLGGWMLLRVTYPAAGRVHWLPLGLRSDDAQTHLRRAALHAHGGPPPAAPV